MAPPALYSVIVSQVTAFQVRANLFSDFVAYPHSILLLHIQGEGALYRLLASLGHTIVFLVVSIEC